MDANLLALAREWTRTDPRAVRADVSRLDLECAANYNLALLRQAVQDGDDRWTPLLPVGPTQFDVMMAALVELEESNEC